MYFYKDKGKQVLDLTGDLILTHNDNSAGASRVRNAHFIDNLTTAGWKRKLKATVAVLSFIWGKNTALTVDVIGPATKINNSE